MTSLSAMTDTLLGRQTFDGLGRQLTVEAGGRVTAYHYRPAQLPPCANTLANGERVDFTYVAALHNAIAAILPTGEPANQFSYHPKLGMVQRSEGPLGSQLMTYTASGQPESDTWQIDGVEHVTLWQYSLGGQLLGYVDADGADHRRAHDAHGRLCQIVVGEIRCDITYDEFSRPCTYTTLDQVGGRSVVQAIDYDDLGREHRRRFTAIADGITQTSVQTLTYTDLNQVSTRHWQDDVHTGQETFGYDLLGRLSLYTADAAIAPTDPFGNRVVRQVFSLNALDGYEQIVSTFADGSEDCATYTYDNSLDPCQVSAIGHTHATWPSSIRLNYDACGRLESDSLGRTVKWDAQDRVTQVEYRGQTCRYGYDPSGNLCDRTVDGALARGFFSAGQLTHEQRGAHTLRPLGDGGQLLGLERLRDGVRQGNVTLYGCDAQGSVRVEAERQLRARRYTAHGAEHDAPPLDGMQFGFAGERREPLTGWYIPGGYRPYDPLLMIFLAPDSTSPFSRGGLNAYAYCAGDPVNRIDPDGHSWWTWVIAGVGLALGVVATVATFGAAAPAFAAVYAGGISALTASGAMAMGAATLGAVSLGTGIASTVLEAVDKDSKAASILGWISLGTGLLGSGLEMAPKAASSMAKIGRRAGKLMNKTRTSTRSTKLTGKAGTSVSLPGNDQPIEVVSFYPNYDGKKTPAFITHGDQHGNLMDLEGKFVPAETLAQDLIGPEIVDYAMAGKTNPEGPLVLIACHSGNSGAAHRVSNTLGIPVISPLGEAQVPRFFDTQQSMLLGQGYGRILSKRSTLPRHLQGKLPRQEYVDAVWNLFLPGVK
ncbi:RHS repeat domain-containing protein [Pseudomonas cremoricolorata]|uniref:RHS repeat domain-containing protein n=1 Tax=Pseudomonas cremoricolorata TaxID=157783 RepID=UPI0009DBDD7D|nr:RHS repeat-associated core domain-containing protein [Pseudomonas cremoricolorata]